MDESPISKDSNLPESSGHMNGDSNSQQMEMDGPTTGSDNSNAPGSTHYALDLLGLSLTKTQSDMASPQSPRLHQYYPLVGSNGLMQPNASMLSADIFARIQSRPAGLTEWTREELMALEAIPQTYSIPTPNLSLFSGEPAPLSFLEGPPRPLSGSEPGLGGTVEMQPEYWISQPFT